MPRRARQTRGTTPILECEDTLTEVLALLPPIALGACAGASKSMLAAVKRTVRSHPGTLDRWSLAAGMCGMPADALCDGLSYASGRALDSTSAARLVVLTSDGQLHNVRVSTVMAKLPIEAHRGAPESDVHGEWGVARFVASMPDSKGSLFCIPCVLGARHGRLVRGAVTVVARLPFGVNKRPLAGLWGQAAGLHTEWFNMCGLWLLPDDAAQEGAMGEGATHEGRVDRPSAMVDLPQLFSARHGHRGSEVADGAAIPLAGDLLDGTVGFLCPDYACYSDGTSLHPFARYMAASPHCNLPSLSSLWRSRIFPWTGESQQSAAQLLRQRLLGLILERGNVEYDRLVQARGSEKRLFVAMPPPRRKHWLTPALLKRFIAAGPAGGVHASVNQREPPMPAMLRARVIACGVDIESVEQLFVRWLDAGMPFRCFDV